MRTRVSSATTEIADVKLVGPEPRRFEVAEGQLQNVRTLVAV